MQLLRITDFVTLQMQMTTKYSVTLLDLRYEMTVLVLVSDIELPQLIPFFVINEYQRDPTATFVSTSWNYARLLQNLAAQKSVLE